MKVVNDQHRDLALRSPMYVLANEVQQLLLSGRGIFRRGPRRVCNAHEILKERQYLAKIAARTECLADPSAGYIRGIVWPNAKSVPKQF